MYEARLRETIPAVRDAIAEAAVRAGRAPSEISLVAVSKGHPVEAVRAALDAGLRDLGENRVSELEDKVAAVGRSGVTWHMVGHIQRRKAPRVLDVADVIHSVDSVRLARRLVRVSDGSGTDEPRVPARLLFQVNTSGEEAKYGFDPTDVVERILEISELPGIDCAGLMTMAPLTEDEELLRRTFRRLRELLEEIRRSRPSFGSQLSMGMTNDLRIAIEEGSTMVRVGTALFGERP